MLTKRWRQWLVRALDDVIALAEYGREQLRDHDDRFMIAPGEYIAPYQLVTFDKHGYVRSARDGEVGFGFAIASDGVYVRVGNA
jgi:hypothetical protein